MKDDKLFDYNVIVTRVRVTSLKVHPQIIYIEYS